MSQTRKQKLKEDLQKQRRRRTTITMTIIVAIAMIAIIVGIILFTRPPPASSQLIGQPIPQSLYTDFSTVSDAALSNAKNAAGVTGVYSNSNAGSPPVTTNPSTPEFLYIGADYCPFCGAERWSMMVALSRFGNFTGVKYMISSDTDTPASVPTLSFTGSSYSSPYITFTSVEVQDRLRNNIATPTATQKSIWDFWDSGEGIPFIDIGNSAGTHYMIGQSMPHSGSQFQPQILTGQNWTQIGSQLDSGSNIATNINAGADFLINAICKLDGGQPTSVCTQTYAQVPFPFGQMPPSTNYQLNVFQMLDGSRTRYWTD